MATLTLTPSNDKKPGTASADSINGLAGNDTLTGLAGKDNLNGGLGNDSLNGGTDNDTLIGDAGLDILLGGTGNDYLDGGADNDRLDGGGGADTLNGGTGADSLTGGDGNDLYFVDNIGDRITEAAKATSGNDTVKSSIDYTLPVNVENLELTGLANLGGTGNDAHNIITGNNGDNVLDGQNGFDTLTGGAGDDTLIGGAGSDSLIGGTGSDTYRIDSTEDQIIEAAKGGDQDVVESSVSYALGAYLEILILTEPEGASSNDIMDGAGNDLNNVMEGNTRANHLTGGKGHDTLFGNGGNDTLGGGAGNDDIDGGSGSDQVIYQGKLGDYKISKDESGHVTIQDSNGNRGDGVDEGTDRLSNIELVQFADQVYRPNTRTVPRLSVTDLALPEDDQANPTFRFELTLSEPATVSVSIDYATADNTATAGEDYLAQKGTLTFKPGETSQTVLVTGLGDTRLERDETFLLQLSNPQGLNLETTQATARLINDDQPLVSIAGARFDEGQNGVRSAELKVTLSEASQSAVSVQYLTQDGSANGSSDYTPTQGALNFAPGDISQTLVLEIRGDKTVEADETFGVQLTNPIGAILDTQASSAQVTLINDDQISLLLSSDRTELKASETALIRFVFSDTPSQFSAEDVSIQGGHLDDFQISNTTGTSYSARFIPDAPLNDLRGSLTVPAGRYTDSQGKPGVASNTLSLFADTQPPSLTLSSDKTRLNTGEQAAVRFSFSEIPMGFGNDDLKITGGSLDQLQAQADGKVYTAIFTPTPNASSPMGSITATSGSFTDALGNPAIVTGRLDLGINTRLPTLSLNPLRMDEGSGNLTPASLILTLSEASTQAVTVRYATQDGSAQAGSDYTASSGTLTFNPGETTKTLSIPIIGDTQPEADESLLLLLTGVTGANLVSNSTTLTLINDDMPLVILKDLTQTEGQDGNPDIRVSVELSAPIDDTVMLDYTTHDITAKAGADYLPAQGTLVFNPRETQKTLSLRGIGDPTVEAHESFELTFSNPRNARLGDISRSLITLNNDDWPTLTVTGASLAEGNSGVNPARINLSLSTASPFPVTIDYRTVDGTALATQDYSPLNGTLTFAPNETSKTLDIKVLGDTRIEPTETFSVNFSNPVNASLANKGVAVITLMNDDTQRPTVSISSNQPRIKAGESSTLTFKFTTYPLDFTASDIIATGGSLSELTPTDDGLNYTARFTPDSPRNDWTGSVKILADTFTDPVGNSNAPSNSLTLTGDTLPPGLVITSDKTRLKAGETATLSFSFSETPVGFGLDDIRLSNGQLSEPSPDVSGKIWTARYTPPTDSEESIAVSVAAGRYQDAAGNPGLAATAPSLAINTHLPVLSISGGITQAEGNSGTFDIPLAITLSEESLQTITVICTTSSGTAQSDSDYTPYDDVLTFQPGETRKTINIRTLGDTTIEADESFDVQLTNPVNAILSSTASTTRLTLSNDDSDVPDNPQTTTRLMAGSVYQGQIDQPDDIDWVKIGLIAGNTYQIRLLGSGSYDGTLADPLISGLYDQSGNPIDAGDDNSGDNNNARVKFLAPYSGDYYLALSGHGGAGSYKATLSQALPRLLITPLRLNEGHSGATQATLTVSLSSPSTESVTVNYQSTDGTASSGSDYTAISGSLIFAPGETSKTIPLRIQGDTTLENDEVFTVNLLDPVNAALGQDAPASITLINDDFPIISLSGANISEGNSASNAAITASLSAASAQTITVNYTTSNGTAMAGSDYTTTSGTLTFNPGETSKTINIPIIGDTVIENNETLTVNLSSPTNATLSSTAGAATVTLTNDDLPILAISGASLTEGNSGSKNATLTVTLSSAASQAITINYASSDGTASSGSDYTAISGVLTFAAGETSKTLTLPITGDTIVEADETLTVNLFNPGNATLSSTAGAATVTLTNDDLPVMSITGASVTEGNSGTSNAAVTVSLSAASVQTITVNYATGSITALAGLDYTAVNGLLTFNPGETSKTINIPIIGDTLIENNETLTVNLSSPINATLSSTAGAATVTLTNDDLPILAISGASLTEGNSGSKNATLTVTLSSAASQAITVNYASNDGTATSGSDYTAISGVLTFAPGETSKTLSIPVTGDTVAEADETLTVNLFNPGNATLSSTAGAATVTLTNDDLPVMSITGTSVTEGNSGTSNAAVTVSLSAAFSQTIKVNYATSNGTAMAGSDYTTTSGTLTFNPGETSKTINIPIIGDTVIENNETLTVNLSSPVNATLSSTAGAATVTLTNDDLPILAISGTSLTEGNSGSKNATLTVTLSSAASQAITVNCASNDGTATSGSDYTAISGVLTFAPGETSKTLTLPITGDTIVEADETLTVNLFNPGNATLSSAAGAATVTLTNDDLPVMSITGASVTEGNSGTSNAVVTVSLSAAFSQTIKVNYATQDGTAKAGSDYTTTSGTLSFAPGETSKTIQVPVIGDTTVESDESFKVLLSAPVNALLNSSASIESVTISNDDTAPSIFVGQPVIDLGAEYGKLIYPVQVDRGHYYYYWDRSGDGSSANTQGSGYANNIDQVDHDWLDKLFQQDVNGQSRTGDTNLYPVPPGNTDNTYRYATINGVRLALPTVGNGDDFIDDYERGGRSGTEVQGTDENPIYDDYLAIWDSMSLYILGDGMPPGWSHSRYWSATPASPGYYGYAHGHALISLNSGYVHYYYGYDRDNTLSGVAVEVLFDILLPTLSISTTTLSEGNSGITNINVAVSMSSAFSQTVTVKYTTQDGTAKAGSDYTASSGTLSFAPGETSRMIQVPVMGDATVEGNESFKVVLSNATNAVLDKVNTSAMVTLTNDDVVTYTKGQAVIDLGPEYGKLINPVQVDGGRVYYYWDLSGNGSRDDENSSDYADSVVGHYWLDNLFQQDVNGRVEGENGAPVVYQDGDTDNTYRYATINGVKLALPTLGDGDNFIESTEFGSRNGTAVSGSAVNDTYDDYLAIWDAYNGTWTGSYNSESTPPGWDHRSYWSATPAASGHALISLVGSVYNYSYDYYHTYVAVEVL